MIRQTLGAADRYENIAEGIRSRSVAWTIELSFAPLRLAPDTWAAAYNAMSQRLIRFYSDAISDGVGHARFSSVHERKARSDLSVSPSKIRLQEKELNVRLDDMQRRVERVLQALFEPFPDLVFEQQIVSFLSAFEPQKCTDARLYVLENLCNHADQISVFFQRPVTRSTVQLFMSGTSGNPGSYQVTVTSMAEQQRDILVEVKGFFAPERIGRNSAKRALKNVERVQEYMHARALPFVKEFDLSLDRL